jgi:hypothetical protein
MGKFVENVSTLRSQLEIVDILRRFVTVVSSHVAFRLYPGRSQGRLGRPWCAAGNEEDAMHCATMISTSTCPWYFCSWVLDTLRWVMVHALSGLEENAGTVQLNLRMVDLGQI